MYIEVRYAKESSGFGDNKAMFRLKKNGKKLIAQETSRKARKILWGSKSSSEYTQWQNLRTF